MAKIDFFLKNRQNRQKTQFFRFLKQKEADLKIHLVGFCREFNADIAYLKWIWATIARFGARGKKLKKRIFSIIYEGGRNWKIWDGTFHLKARAILWRWKNWKKLKTVFLHDFDEIKIWAEIVEKPGAKSKNWKKRFEIFSPRTHSQKISP